MGYTRTSTVAHPRRDLPPEHRSRRAAARASVSSARTSACRRRPGSLLKCEQKAETPGKPPIRTSAGASTRRRASSTAAPIRRRAASRSSRTSPQRLRHHQRHRVGRGLGRQLRRRDRRRARPDAGTQSKCGVGKKKCVAKKLESILKCHQKAQTPGKSMDPNIAGCINKATDEVRRSADPSKGCFAKLEKKPERLLRHGKFQAALEAESSTAPASGRSSPCSTRRPPPRRRRQHDTSTTPRRRQHHVEHDHLQTTTTTSSTTTTTVLRGPVIPRLHTTAPAASAATRRTARRSRSRTSPAAV